MGIDGAGKTSLLKYLVRALTAAGVECVDVSKKPAIRAARGSPGFPGRSIERLWLESWRLLLGGGQAGGKPVDAVLPLQFSELTEVSSGWILDMLPDKVADVRRAGPVASMLTEMTIDQIVRAEVTGPVLNGDSVAVADGFGFKTAMKNICIARELPADTISDHALDGFERLVRVAYSAPFLQPDVGLFLDVDPRRSYGWRLLQDGRLGAAEDMWLAGRHGPDSFTDLQSAVAEELRMAAADWGWHTIQIDGRAQEETAAEAASIVMRHPGIQRLTNLTRAN